MKKNQSFTIDDNLIKLLKKIGKGKMSEIVNSSISHFMKKILGENYYIELIQQKKEEVKILEIKLYQYKDLKRINEEILSGNSEVVNELIKQFNHSYKTNYNLYDINKVLELEGIK